MKKQGLIVLALIIGTVLLFGCTAENVRTVSGNGSKVTISETGPIILDVSGNNNNVEVLADTNVILLNLSGNNNTIILPQGLKPKINQSGNANNVEYR